jgi:hypothetical protein
MRAAAKGISAALLAAVLLGGCVSPAIDEAGYRGKVGHSVNSMLGILGTARLAGQLDLRGKLTEAARDTVVSDAENDASSVLTSFQTVQPPDEAMIKLYNQADKVLQQAAGDISDLRIAQRAGNHSATMQALSSLGGDLKTLQKFGSSG